MSEPTTWWWVRHAPVVNTGGRIYGSSEVDCDCSDEAVFRGLAEEIPEDGIWVTSHLSRARRTAEAILGHRETNATPLVVEGLAEQSFGAWQSLTHEEVRLRNEGVWHRFWLTPAHVAPPEGESFAQVCERVRTAIEDLNARFTGRHIVAVAHGGTIRAALGLALALDPDRALAFQIGNCMLTRLEHFAEGRGPHATDENGAWRVSFVNRDVRKGAITS